MPGTDNVSSTAADADAEGSDMRRKSERMMRIVGSDV